MQDFFRKPRFEQLNPRLCMAFGDVDLNFAADAGFEDSYAVSNRADEVVGIIQGADGSQMVIESIRSGSGYALGFSKIDPGGAAVSDFGTGGHVEWFDRDHPEAVVNAFRITNGNIVVRTTRQNNSSFASFQSDGSLDTSFADQGLLRLGGGLRWDSVAHPAGGFILLEQVNLEMIITRFTNDGELDAGFGINGRAYLPAIYQPQIQVDADGGILFFGSRWNSNTPHSVIVRLLADGAPDEDYGSGGVRSGPAPYLQRMYMAPSGDVYFTVRSADDANVRTYTVERYTNQMLLDDSFGVKGVMQFQVPKGRYTHNLFVRPTVGGDIYIEQTWVDQRASRIVMAHVDSAGKLDTSFGNAGIVQLALDEQVFARGLYRDGVGNLYWLGNYQPDIHSNSKTDGFIVRFAQNGVLDTSWADAGRRGIDRTVGAQMIEQIELVATHRGTPLITTGWRGYETQDYSTGRVHVSDETGVSLTANLGNRQWRRPLVIGASHGGWYTISATGSTPVAFTIQRFHADATQDASFGDAGSLTIVSPSAHDIVARMDDTGAVTIVASDYETSADPEQGVGVAVIVRLTSDGRLDETFGDGGVLRLYEKPSGIVDVMVSPLRGVVLVYQKSTLQAFDWSGQPIPDFGTNGIAKPMGVSPRGWATGEIDEAGNIVGIVRNYYSDFTQTYSMVKLNLLGSLEPSFGDQGEVALPWEWNTAYDSPQMAIQSGVILLANAQGRHQSTVRLLAYDYNGVPIEALGGAGYRDYDFSPNGELVTGLEFAEDGSVWLGLIERRGFDETGAVYRLSGSDRGRMHNWIMPLDVNRDYLITPIDVLQVINRINGQVWDQFTRPDANNDDLVTPQDVLLIINHINRHSAGESEGEHASAASGLDVSWLFADERDEWYKNWRV